MKRALWILLPAIVGLAGPAAAAITGPVGDVFVVVDQDGTIQQPEFSLDPAVTGLDAYKAAQAFYLYNPDDFHILTVFSTANAAMLGSPMGVAAQNAIKGIGTNGVSTSPFFNNTKKFGPTNKLQIVVKMLGVFSYPSYDQLETTVVPMTSLSPIELLAHETGHRWLAWVRYDLGDGERRTDLRGYSAKGHWNYFYNSGQSAGSSSVEHGNEWLEVPGEPGCFVVGDPKPFRKYSPLDQYLMGLRGPGDVPPGFLIVDPKGYYPDDTNKAPGPAGTKACGEKREITIADVIRAEGERKPSWQESPHEFRNAFILVVAKTDSQKTIQDGVAIVDGFRRKWEEYFPVATDGRGTVVTALDWTPPEPVPDQATPPEAADEALPDPGPTPPDAAGVDVPGVDAPAEAAVVDAAGETTVPADAAPPGGDVATDGGDGAKGGGCSGGPAAGALPGIVLLGLGFLALGGRAARPGSLSRSGRRAAPPSAAAR